MACTSGASADTPQTPASRLTCTGADSITRAPPSRSADARRRCANDVNTPASSDPLARTRTTPFSARALATVCKPRSSPISAALPSSEDVWLESALRRQVVCPPIFAGGRASPSASDQNRVCAGPSSVTPSAAAWDATAAAAICN